MNGPKAWVKAAFEWLGLAVMRRSTLDQLCGTSEPDPLLLPPGARAFLRLDNPRLRELERRYEGHPAASHTQWNPGFVRRNVDLTRFRAENAFMAQHALEPDRRCRYALTTMYVRDNDPMRLLDRLDEDGLFGVSTLDADGQLVSRDLLDSILQLNFLDEIFGLSQASRPVILDIGAGYGRLAHRAVDALPSCTYICTDAVAVSTFLSEYYLEFRGATRAGARVIPLDEIDDALGVESVDIAVNVHSFSECPIAAIEWWLDLLERHRVRDLFIVPNEVAGRPTGVYSTEYGDGHIDYQPLLERHGYTLTTQRPMCVESLMLQRYGIWPAHFFAFSRT